MFRNITKLASYDKDKQEFPKRSKSTTNPFPDINREALAYMEDSLSKHYGLKDFDPNNPDEQIDQSTQELLDQDANFASLYKRSIEYAAPKHAENLNVTDGQWVKFDQTNDESKAKELANSLHGYNTGWCTAGEGTASAQLRGGDFYVYYSRAEDGQYSVPRVAIRMEGSDEHATFSNDVRGIEADQNLEGSLAGITEAKMNEINAQDAVRFKKKSADMHSLTIIEELLQPVRDPETHRVLYYNNPHAELSDDDLIFIYELKSPIEGFGYEPDPRIEQLLELRKKYEHAEDGGLMESGETIDTERLRPLLIEGLHSQAETSFVAVTTVIETLNKLRSPAEQIPTLSPEQYHHAFEAKWAEWQANGTLEWVASRFETHNERYTLVGTPNILADHLQILGLADEFAKGQGFDEAYKSPDLYKLYSAEELSGALEPDQLIRFSLLPDNYTPELGSNDVATQLGLLAELQSANPGPTIATPSVLEAENYWFARRSGGDSLSSGDVWQRTYIRYIDLPAQTLGGDSIVPYSDVLDGGEPSLFRNDSASRLSTRVSLG